MQRALQLSSGWGGTRLLIMMHEITKWNYDCISSQKILGPKLPSHPLYLSFLFPFVFPLSILLLLTFLSPPPHLPPLPALQQTEMTSPPRWWTAVFRNSVYICGSVCVYMCLPIHKKICLRLTSWLRTPSVAGDCVWRIILSHNYVCENCEWCQIK